MLNNYKSRLTQLSYLPKNVEPRNKKILTNNIALLELTFTYTIWHKGNMDINDLKLHITRTKKRARRA